MSPKLSHPGQPSIPAAYRAVHRYARERQRSRHDVFGWYRAGDGQAVLQIDPEADERSFPREIDGVQVRLWKAAAPEP